MRAKLQVSDVKVDQACDTVRFHAVSRNDGYPEDGSDENNTFARFSPSASLEIQIANPELFGKLRPGQTFYVDFTPADQ
jgi:hypothetical protein